MKYWLAALSLKTKPYENHCCDVSSSSGLINTQCEQLELHTPRLLLNHCVRKKKKKKTERKKTLLQDSVSLNNTIIYYTLFVLPSPAQHPVLLAETQWLLPPFRSPPQSSVLGFYSYVAVVSHGQKVRFVPLECLLNLKLYFDVNSLMFSLCVD